MSELKDYSILDIEAIDDERFKKEKSPGKWVPESRVYLKEDVESAIAELEAENERLKKCEIWMKQHFYCEEVIACESAKNRRLKRALWLARAERAKEFRYKIKFAISSMNTKYNYSDADKWEKVERKCRAKAEEYK